MFATSEEHHECNSKGKPRSRKSQGGDVNIDVSIRDNAHMNIDESISASGLSKQGTNHVDSTEKILKDKKVIVNEQLTISRDLQISIEVAKLKDYRRVARTLQLSFEHDPFVNYILNTEMWISPSDKMYKKRMKRKNELMLSFFEYSAYECLRAGGLVVVIDDVSQKNDLAQVGVNPKNLPFLGVACWNRLEFDSECFAYEYPDMKSVFDNLHPSYVKFNLISFKAKCRQKIMKDKLPYLNHVRDNVLKKLRLNSGIDSVWYLNDLGVIPSMQGKGLAKTLVNHCLKNYIDILPNSWCYLESTNPSNRVFYEKLGFTVANTFAINEAESNSREHPLNMDAMFRYPKTKVNLIVRHDDVKLSEPHLTVRQISV